MSTEIPLDNDTRAALLLFNERLEETAALKRGQKRVAKAERAKESAAALVRKLGDNPNASAEEKAEAETAYKAAVENYNVIKADPDAEVDSPKPPAAEDSDAGEAEAEPEAAESEAAESEAEANEPEAPEPEAKEADDPPPSEVSADEEPPKAEKATGDESD